MTFPHIDIMQKRIEHAKTLVKYTNLSITKHMMELSTELHIELYILKVLQDNWDENISLILKVHNNFLSHFCITLQILTFLTKTRGKIYMEEEICLYEKKRVQNKNCVEDM